MPSTNAQQLQQYAQNLAQGGASRGLYTGLTTGAGESANYATNLQTLLNGSSQTPFWFNMGGQSSYSAPTVQAPIQPRGGGNRYADPSNRLTRGGGTYSQTPSGANTVGAPSSPSVTDPRNASPAGPQVPYNGTSANSGSSNPYQTPSPPVASTPRDANGFGTLPGLANVGTSIVPRQLFSADDTAARLAAQAAQFNNDPNFLMKQFSRPGRSLDSGSLAMATPQMAEAGGQMLRTIQQVPFDDAMANSQFQLQGEQAQGQEGLALANLLRRVTGANDFEKNQQIATLVGLLGGM